MPEKLPGSDSPKRASSPREPVPFDKTNVSTESLPGNEVIFTGWESAEKVIAELEALFDQFRQAHDLDTLRSVQANSTEELKANAMREDAKRYLPYMVRLINHIERLPDVSEREFMRLFKHYKSIQAAIGTFNSGRLDHSVRETWIRVP